MGLARSKFHEGDFALAVMVLPGWITVMLSVCVRVSVVLHHNQTVKLSPQPQVPFTLGLLN